MARNFYGRSIAIALLLSMFMALSIVQQTGAQSSSRAPQVSAQQVQTPSSPNGYSDHGHNRDHSHNRNHNRNRTHDHNRDHGHNRSHNRNRNHDIYGG